MKYYRFKTFRTSYYFPETDSRSRFLYGVYHPYGSLPVKLYWKLFTSCKWVRTLSVVDENQLDFPYRTIMDMCPANALVSFNLGTPGDEQKISMLGYIPGEDKSFFAKYSTKDKAKALSKNEIWVLRELEGRNLSPVLLDVKENDEEVFFVTSRVCGNAYSSFELSEEILDILISLGSVKLEDGIGNELAFGLSHGDFCPWNMLQDGTKIRLIDWEMAANRPLGYDLFLFIIHTHLVMGADEKRILALLKENTNYITKYFNAFNISDYRPYLLSFLTARLKDEQDKAHQQMVKRYQQILLSI
ncbi:phosphotransferase [Parabacteroides distasonis]|uniref:phosphotransferase n=1 Tax=Parabacteroides distasonis TaxID=823 RepID=UPI00189B5626|nr:phosphotransferase [Parabacteroides distasonis]MDB9131736.1 phosphotransferase [Parabacteroides distasonis]